LMLSPLCVISDLSMIVTEFANWSGLVSECSSLILESFEIWDVFGFDFGCSDACFIALLNAL
jgi:hypothetical protein